MIRAYDDYGNVVDLVEWEQKIREDALKIDMDKPMHFTDEQKAWVKNYIIINAERQRADVIDEVHNLLHDRLCELSGLNTLLMSNTELGRLASVLSECNKWLDAIEQLKEKKE